MVKEKREMSNIEIFYNTESITDNETKEKRPCSIIHFNKDGEVTHEEHHNMEKLVIPESAIESFAKALIPDILEFFSTEEGQRAFAQYQEKQKE